LTFCANHFGVDVDNEGSGSEVGDEAETGRQAILSGQGCDKRCLWISNYQTSDSTRDHRTVQRAAQWPELPIFIDPRTQIIPYRYTISRRSIVERLLGLVPLESFKEAVLLGH
jgi:pyruvate-formate lyase-activating enzyme